MLRRSHRFVITGIFGSSLCHDVEYFLFTLICVVFCFQSLATPWIFGHSVWTGFPPVRRSVYVTALRHWYETFPANQIHVVDGEKLITDPLSVVKRLERFIGLKPFYTEEHFPQRRKDGFPCAYNWRKKQADCFQSGKGHVHKALSDTTQKVLTDYFRPHTDAMYRLIGQKFDW